MRAMQALMHVTVSSGTFGRPLLLLLAAAAAAACAWMLLLRPSAGPKTCCCFEWPGRGAAAAPNSDPG